MFGWLRKQKSDKGKDKAKDKAARKGQGQPSVASDPNAPADRYYGIGDEDFGDVKLSRSLEKNIAVFKTLFNGDDTMITREFQNQNQAKVRGCLIYFEGMTDNLILVESVMGPMMTSQVPEDGDLLDTVEQRILQAAELKRTQNIPDIVSNIVYGDTALLLDGYDQVLILNTKGFKTRSIAEPDSEKVLSGPREGFTESMVMNLSMLRRKVRSHRLRVQYKTFGTTTKTRACICYIEGTARQDLLDELNRRLSTVDLDGVLDVNYIGEYIKDAKYSIVQTIGKTEKPDVVAAKLLEGRIALMLDGTPMVLTMPYLFVESFQADDDYYLNPYYASFARLLRMTSFFLTISIPAFYLALANYHPEMVPTPLLISLASSRMNVPFPAALELTLMMIAFDALREAGLRMPSSIGQALSIVGALVVGQAAVEAKIVSATVVIIAAMAGITGLMNPRIKGSSIFMRLVFLVLTMIMGLYGLIFGLAGLFLHLVNLKSFGLPIMTPLTLPTTQDVKDIFFRSPWWSMLTRPTSLTKNRYRTPERVQGKVTNQPPPRPQQKGEQS